MIKTVYENGDWDWWMYKLTYETFSAESKLTSSNFEELAITVTGLKFTHHLTC